MTTKEANLWQNRGILMVLLIFCLTPLNLTAQENPTMPLQMTLGDFDVSSDWIYDDLDRGIAQAKETGKPLFVLFR